MLPSLSAKTIGMSKILVFDRSGVGGDLVDLKVALVVGVVLVETPPEPRTIVNLVGLNDCGWVCFDRRLGVLVGGFGITETTGFGEDLSVKNFCVVPDGFN